MKTKITLLLTLVTTCASAFEPIRMIPYGTNYGAIPLWWTNTPSATWLTNWQAWQTVNTNFASVDEQLSAIPDAHTNSVLSSPRQVAWTSNSITIASATNVVLGWVTNWSGATYETVTGMAGLELSTDGTNFPHYADIVTNVPVLVRFRTPEVPAMGTPITTVITNFTAYSLTRPDLFGKEYHTYGARLFVQPPAAVDEAASKGYVDDMVALVNPYQTGGIFLDGAALNMDASWTVLAGSNGYAMRYLGSDALSVSPKGVLSFGYSTAISLSGNTVTVKVWTNGITAAPAPQWTDDLAHPKWTLIPNVTNTYPTATGTNYILTFPKPATNACFIRVGYGLDYPSVAALSGVLALPLQTITNATQTTWGRGAGIACWDTNYLYISVGTNAWRRAALTNW